MIIDIHTHIGSSSMRIFHNLYPCSLSARQLVEEMNRCNVDYSVAFPFPETLFYDPREYKKRVASKTGLMDFPYQIENANLIYQAEQFGKGRILPFACIDPRNEVDLQVESLRRYANEKKIYGIKVHTKTVGHSAESFIGSQFSSLAKEFNLPFLFHTLHDPESDPISALRFAVAEPKINVCIAHAGGFQKEFFDKLRKSALKNVFFDMAPLKVLSAIIRDEAAKFGNQLIDVNYENPGSIVEDLSREYIEHMLFGSDQPYTVLVNPLEGAEFSSSLRDELDIYSDLNDISRRKIFESNAIRFLGRSPKRKT